MFRIVVDPRSPDTGTLRQVSEWLAGGGLVVFPTDTVYGIGAVPSLERAVREIFDVKGRDDRAAVPLVASSTEQVKHLAPAWGGSTAALAERFWPGPLSLLIDAPPGIAAAVHAGQHTLAVRVPNHVVARAVAAAAGGLVTATSANRSGHPAVSTVDALDRVGTDPRVLVLDAGPSPGGAPSTIVDARGAAPILIREGAIPFAEVQAALGR